jgi:hypothetical protein
MPIKNAFHYLCWRSIENCMQLEFFIILTLTKCPNIHVISYELWWFQVICISRDLMWSRVWWPIVLIVYST